MIDRDWREKIFMPKCGDVAAEATEAFETLMVVAERLWLELMQVFGPMCGW